MKDYGLGKRLYKSSAIPSAKLFIVLIIIGLFINLIIKTYSNPLFLQKSSFNNFTVMDFNLMYPEQLLIYLIFVLFPGIYYGFIRGIYFFEKGIIINRGLPFLNYVILYKNIQSYKIKNPKYLMSVTKTDTSSEIIFTICKSDRAVAILDQHGIKGILAKEKLNEMSANKKLFFYTIVFGIIIYFIQQFDLILK